MIWITEKIMNHCTLADRIMLFEKKSENRKAKTHIDCITPIIALIIPINEIPALPTFWVGVTMSNSSPGFDAFLIDGSRS